jgi:hypothetical protein
MAARGTIAKTNVENVIKEAFGENFAGIADKKLYVWCDDGGEKVQIAITLTCPKTNVDFGDNTGGFIEAGPATGLVGSYVGKRVTIEPIVEMTPEEEKNIATLIARLGL